MDVEHNLQAMGLELPAPGAPPPGRAGAVQIGKLRFVGGQGLEMVVIPEPGRGTLCISRQVGCQLVCQFFSTGGEGFNRNLPLPGGTDGAAYATALADGLAMIDTFDPDAPLVLSLGFDTFVDDPIGGFILRTDDYARLGALVRGLDRGVVALQEGGYAVEAIGANALAFLEGLVGRRVAAPASV